MKTHHSWFVGTVLAGLLVTGCATHPAQVSCEGHLEPINAAAPKAAVAAAVEQSGPVSTGPRQP